MSRSSEEELGRRRFEVQKTKAVEEAYEKIRRSFGHEWQIFSAEDCAVLREILADIWISVDRTRWNNYCFSTLSQKQIHSLIGMGKAGLGLKNMTTENLDRLDEILDQCRGGS
jgi:hypothetical protein